MVSFCGLCWPKAAPKPGAGPSDRPAHPVGHDDDDSRRKTSNAPSRAPRSLDSAVPKSSETSALPKKYKVAIEIWGSAYSELQEAEADMVEVYEKILSQQVSESMLGDITTAAMNIFADATVPIKIARMNQVTQKTLEKVTEHAKLQQGVSQTVTIITGLGKLVGTALEANPVAGLAWSGICAALPVRYRLCPFLAFVHSFPRLRAEPNLTYMFEHAKILMKPITAGKAMAEGLQYMTGRMEWYLALVGMLLEEDNANDVQLQATLKKNVQRLYKSILQFEMQSVCYCYHDHPIVRGLKAMVMWDDWESRLQALKVLESEIITDLGQFTGHRSLQVLKSIDGSTKQLDDVSKSLRKLVAFQEQSQKEGNTRAEAEHLQLIGKLRTSDYERQMRINPKRVPGTCEWFIRHENFRNWLDSSHSGVLLVSADPGCGKSVLARYLVEDFLPNHEPGTTVAFYFFKDIPEQKYLANALCALLHKLFSEDEQLIKRFRDDIAKNESKLTSDTSLLWGMFTRAVSEKSSGPVICVLDALDECDSNDLGILINELQQVNQSDKSQARFLLTTRGYPSILQEFHDTHYILLSGDEKSQKEEIQAEINLVLDFKLEELCNKKHLSLERKQSIRDALLLKSSEQRTYLWLSLVFEVLERNFKNTESEWKNLINNPPANINLAYEKLLNRVNQNQQGQIRKLLQLVLAAFRPLTLREMNIALHVGDYIDRGLTSENDLDLSPDGDFKLWMLQTCGFFVTVYDDKVFFIHQTAKEFLLVPNTQRCPENNTVMSWCHTFTDREAHCSVAESCIAYLALKQFSSIQFKIRADEAIPKTPEIDPLALGFENFTGCETLNEYYNFFHYTTKYWLLHFRMCQNIPEDISQTTDVGEKFFPHYLALFGEDPDKVPPWLVVNQTLLSRPDSELQAAGIRSYTENNYSLANIAALFSHIRLMEHALRLSQEDREAKVVEHSRSSRR